MGRFVAYLTNPTKPEEATPVATGADKETATKAAIPRVLAGGMLAGEIVVQDREDIDAETFQRLETHLADQFKKMGIG